jgi:site-specific DNA recombinase
LKEIEKRIENIITAIENGIFNKTTQNKLLELEQAKSDLEDQIAIQESIAIKPLELSVVKEFIESFKRLDYSKEENRVKLFEMFVNRVDLFDDTMSVSYNATLNPVKEIKLNKNTESELVFKFGAFGGEDGIRTHAPVKA